MGIETLPAPKRYPCPDAGQVRRFRTRSAIFVGQFGMHASPCALPSSKYYTKFTKNFLDIFLFPTEWIFH